MPETLSTEQARAQAWEIMLAKAREAQDADPKAVAATKTLLADPAWKEQIEASVTAPVVSEIARKEPAVEPPAYEVHPGTGLRLQRSGEYWLYEGEWLTDEQLTATVPGPAPAAEQAAESPEAILDDFVAMMEEIPGIDQLSEDEIAKIIGEAIGQSEG
jgi:hypothetical protein